MFTLYLKTTVILTFYIPTKITKICLDYYTVLVADKKTNFFKISYTTNTAFTLTL